MDKIEVTQADLLPCPFCGGEGYTYRHFYWVAICRNCGCEVPSENNGDSMDTAHSAATCWNHRATHTDATPVTWMPIDSAPTDWDDVVVYSPDHAGFNCGGVFLAFCDPDDDIWYAHGPSGNIRLHPTHWQPLPAAPDATNTHPPATDVAALVEAAKAFVDGASHTMVFLKSREKMHPAGQDLYNDDVERLRQALAPFTKGRS